MNKRINVIVVLVAVGVLCTVTYIRASEPPPPPGCAGTISVRCHTYKHIDLGPCGNGIEAEIYEGAGNNNVNICTGSGNGTCTSSSQVQCQYSVTTDDCNGNATSVEYNESVISSSCN